VAIAKQRRALDLPRLLRSITHTHHRATDALARLKTLDGWPADPRAALGVVRNLESIPFHTSSTKPFWDALIAFAATHGDLRSADALAGVAKRLPKILRSQYADLTGMRAWFAKQITTAAEQIRAGVTEPALDAATVAACARIAEQIVTFEDTTDRLLAEIAANPDDDQLRQVYADGLQQKGDPRGELIALQLANREPARQEQLLAAHAAQWLGPIAPIAWVDGTVFERGFPVAVWLNNDRNTDALERAVGHPVWATVRRVELLMDTLPAALLEHRVMAQLEHFGAYEADVVLERLSWREVPFRSLGIDSHFANARGEQRAFLAADKKLAKLRAVELGGAWFSEPTAASWLLGSPIGKRLEHIAIVDRMPVLSDWVGAVAKLAIGTLAYVESGRHGGRFELARDRSGGFSTARVRLGGAPGKKRDRRELDYAGVVTLLDSLATDSLARLEITGPPPKPAERKRLNAACRRFAKLALALVPWA